MFNFYFSAENIEICNEISKKFFFSSFVILTKLYAILKVLRFLFKSSADVRNLTEKDKHTKSIQVQENEQDLFSIFFN